ncbi:hypothetical protein LBMAG42_28010 [Deltaproteobacteria bacterium]|nr:hypothetical protein LBMAG42_28010 [Deltaproteobacteria bacterium]
MVDLEGPDPDASIFVRVLSADDHARIVRIDERITRRSRGEWYRQRLHRALAEGSITVSLGAVLDGHLVGALLGTLQYGEFGSPEPIAVLDTIVVDPDYSARGVGRALVDQLVKNLRGLRVERIRTEVDWSERSLMGFLAHAGFQPVPRLVLELPLREP